MSDMTSTNEETLINLIADCPEGSHIELSPRDGWIKIYECTEDRATRTWRASFLLLSIHPEAWLVNPGIASQWR